ncbi:hypothetical protein FALBO_14132 [Fusarium albosuccineum]|uniref:Azaphilone pigments biosynthesis cluster protein L N-terminal domain-containing protein n=1 Tax=Fusarium albosuccineum TaxID=1237068 RepID=A0A8H4KYL8_9HYPO|nr:hypothetical protein FALBO_14132 [Fusarium albosuccineum]
MDPVSAGASVVTFITLAFSASKTIHNVLSSIKDGPRVIRDLGDEISQLQSILGRISQISFDPVDVNDVTELGGLGRKCADDMTSFESKLKHVNVSEADGRSGRLWRKLKHCLTEKGLEQMRQVIRGHVQLLTIRLTLMQTQQLSLSATQSTEILNLLQQLKHDVTTLHKNSVSAENSDMSPTGSGSRVVELNSSETMPSTDSTLTESITRLVKLVDEKTCVVESDNAEQLLDDLEHLLKSIQRAEAAKDSAEKAVYSSQVDHSKSEDFSKELRLVTSLVLSAPSININQTGPLRFLTDIPEGTIIHQQRKRKTIEIADGVITWTSSKRRRKSPTLGDIEDITRVREFWSKIVFKPRNTNHMLMLSVNQGKVLFDSFASMLPRITVSNILPAESLVFKLAAGGRIQDLIRLVSEDRGSLNDHDTNGWSLLHIKVLMARIRTAFHLARERPDMAQILLNAGADPTINVHGLASPISLIANQHSSTSDDILRQAFDSPFLCYADSETLVTDSIFLEACDPTMEFEFGELDPPIHIKKLAFLLSRGYTVSDKDHFGHTCLLRFFSSGLGYRLNQERWKDILVYLVQMGADVHATNTEGKSVSMLAYGQGLCGSCSGLYSSFTGDLWDAVLDSCGYAISEFRKLCPRRPLYIDDYTRHTFDKLWQGRENRCPYWNDDVWPEDEAPWISINSDDKKCEKCYDCFKADRSGSGERLCGCCGYCAAVLDCFCFYWGKEGCQHPRRAELIWDKSKSHYILVKKEPPEERYKGERPLDNEETCDSAQTPDAESADEEVQSIDNLSWSCDQRDQSFLAGLHPHLNWNTGLFSGGYEHEATGWLDEYTASDSKSEAELFRNPWKAE